MEEEAPHPAHLPVQPLRLFLDLFLDLELLLGLGLGLKAFRLLDQAQPIESIFR